MNQDSEDTRKRLAELRAKILSCATAHVEVVLDDPDGGIDDLIQERYTTMGEGGKPQRVSLYGKTRNWIVRVSAAGEYFTVGVFKNYNTAIRFSDMVTLLLWPYRQRDRRPVTDRDLNLSIEQAKADIEDGGRLAIWAKDVVNIMLVPGVPLTTDPAKTTATRHTVRNDLIYFVAEVKEELMAAILATEAEVKHGQVEHTRIENLLTDIRDLLRKQGIHFEALLDALQKSDAEVTTILRNPDVGQQAPATLFPGAGLSNPGIEQQAPATLFPGCAVRPITPI